MDKVQAKEKTIEELDQEILKYEGLITDCDICLSHLKPGTRGAHDKRDLLDYYRSQRAVVVKERERRDYEQDKESNRAFFKQAD